MLRHERCDATSPLDSPYWKVVSSILELKVCRDCMEAARVCQRAEFSAEGRLMIWSPQVGAFI